MNVLEGWPGHRIAQTLFVQAARSEWERQGWVVYEEYEYVHTVARFPKQERVRSALANEMVASKAKPKPDVTMISPHGDLLWVLEIGTRKSEKELQLFDRLIWWRHCLRIRGIWCIVEPARWLPPRGIVSEVQGCSVCSEPTWRLRAPTGVILYELHEHIRRRVPLPAMQDVRSLGRHTDRQTVIQNIRRQHALVYDEVIRKPSVPGDLLAPVLILAVALAVYGLAIPAAAALAILLIVERGQTLSGSMADLRLT